MCGNNVILLFTAIYRRLINCTLLSAISFNYEIVLDPIIPSLPQQSFEQLRGMCKGDKKLSLGQIHEVLITAQSHLIEKSLFASITGA